MNGFSKPDCGTTTLLCFKKLLISYETHLTKEKYVLGESETGELLTGRNPKKEGFL